MMRRPEAKRPQYRGGSDGRHRSTPWLRAVTRSSRFDHNNTRLFTALDAVLRAARRLV